MALLVIFAIVLVLGPAAATVTSASTEADPLASPRLALAGSPDVAHGQTTRPNPAAPDRDASTAATAADYTLRLICQGVAQNQAVVADDTGCPAYVLDAHDAMAQPRLVVDPDNPSVLGFSALHGGQAARTGLDGGPPSVRSRADEVHQPHTTFRTVDAGTNWQDMPYYAPETIAEAGDEVYGEDNAITVDIEGRLYLAAAYAHRTPTSNGFTTSSEPFAFSVALWKAGSLYRPVDYRTGLTIIRAGDGNDTTEDTSPAPRIVDLGLVHDAVADRVIATWREVPVDPDAPDRTAPITNPGALRIVITDPASGGDWDPVSLPGTPNACRHLTAPIARHDGIVVGCVLDAETAGATTPSSPTATNTSVTFDDDVLRIFRIDLVNGTTTTIAELVTPGDAPVLFTRGERGHLVAAGARLDAQSRPHVLIAYGDADDRWTSPRDITPDITALDSTTAAENARVTAGVFRPDSGHIHLISQVRRGGEAVSQGAASEGTGSAFSKALVVLRGEEAVVLSLDLGVGMVARTDAATNPNPTDFGAFDDLHDGLVVWEHDGEVIEYVAYGDNGYVRFAEVDEQGFAPPPVLVAPQTIAVPLTTAGANPVVYGSAAAVLSSAMVARFVARRNKVTTDVEVGA